MRRARESLGGVKGQAATAVIVALVIVNVVLVALALRPRSASDTVNVTVGSPSLAGSPTPSSTPWSPARETSSPSTSEATLEPAPLRVLVSAVSAKVAWRARSTECGGAASQAAVERTDDGGATWVSDPVPDRVVVRVNARSKSSAFVVSAGDTCEPRLRSTVGDGWTAPGPVSNAWYRSPSDATRLGVPGGEQVRPCAGSQTVIDMLADSASHAAVLCGDGRVRRTTDGGGSWSDVSTAVGALAFAKDPDGSGYVVALAAQRGCPGLAVVEVARSQAVRGCVASVTKPVPGEVAMSSAGGATWLLAGSTQFVSTDGARTFASPSS